MAKKEEPKTLTLGGGFDVTKGSQDNDRMAVLIWGAATCGKTTFAATAPGDKLWLSFGDNEHVSIKNRDDVYIVKLADLRYDDLFKHAQSDNPFGLDKFLTENANIETVVCDSVTAIEYKALQKAVGEGIGAGKGFRPTMEAPGISAYGGRNAILLETLTGILRVTAKHNVHVIFTAHEADPTYLKGEQKDTIEFISIQLGGKLVNGVTWRLSEIWYMSQEATGTRNRKIAIRATRLRRPMKSRMFKMNEEAEFIVDYDAEKPDKGQMTIADFYEQWIDSGCKKISIPKAKVKK